MGNRAGRDTIFCFDAATGRPLWQYGYTCGGGDYGGPRCTPTVDSGRVYTISREGHAVCVNASNGRPVWQKNLAQIARAETPRWGFAGSPLILGKLVLYNVGTAGVALDKTNGREAWISGPAAAGYSSPVAFTAGGQQGVAFFVGWGLVGLNGANGKPFWQYRWQTDFDVNAADPIFSGDTVFISSNYNRGCALLRVGGGKAGIVWENRNMRNHFNSCILIGGYLYGNDQNTLKCMELKTGRERWQARGMGRGGLIAADGKLIAMNERGELFVAAANPDRYTEIARARVMNGTCWTQPVIANGLIYCRSHEGELVCLDVRGRR